MPRDGNSAGGPRSSKQMGPRLGRREKECDQGTVDDRRMTASTLLVPFSVESQLQKMV